MGESADFTTKPSRSAATRATYLQLVQASALIAPQWFIDACENAPASEIAEPRLLVDMARHYGYQDARILSEEAIYLLDEVPHYAHPNIENSESVIISLSRGDAEIVEHNSPADDYISSQPSARDFHFTAVSEENAEAWATGAYDIWEGLVADLAVLVRPEFRRHGFGKFVTGVASEDALAEGLVPQFRVGMGNTSAMILAESLGFELSGSVTSVYLGTPTTTPR
jgi:GNAT superfamily N-acetyltransferase